LAAAPPAPRRPGVEESIRRVEIRVARESFTDFCPPAQLRGAQARLVRDLALVGAEGTEKAGATARHRGPG
jgi:hypothetical protein